MMRYVRVLALAMTGDWYDNVIARDNYPFGLVLSWTRLFDLLILLPAYGR
jgi:asparagine N-glycosylation enzyme membrane subunit Stt3